MLYDSIVDYGIKMLKVYIGMAKKQQYPLPKFSQVFNDAKNKNGHSYS